MSTISFISYTSIHAESGMTMKNDPPIYAYKNKVLHPHPVADNTDNLKMLFVYKKKLFIRSRCKWGNVRTHCNDFVVFHRLVTGWPWVGSMWTQLGLKKFWHFGEDIFKCIHLNKHSVLNRILVRCFWSSPALQAALVQLMAWCRTNFDKVVWHRKASPGTNESKFDPSWVTHKFVYHMWNVKWHSKWLWGWTAVSQ